MEQGRRNLIVAAISAVAALTVLAVFVIAVSMYTGSAEKHNSSHYMDVLESSEYHITNSEHRNSSEAESSEKLSPFDNNSELTALTEADQAADSDNKETYICVFVCGKVKQAGTYQLLSGARLGECIEAAGGFSKRADREYLNLAQEAQDGQRIYIPSKKETKKTGRKASQNSTDGQKTAGETIDSQNAQTSINLNTASKEELMQLNGIGEAKANAIISYR